MKNTMPLITESANETFGKEYRVFDPNTGIIAAVFYNEALLRAMLTEMFGLSAFDSLPIVDEQVVWDLH